MNNLSVAPNEDQVDVAWALSLLLQIEKKNKLKGNQYCTVTELKSLTLFKLYSVRG